MIREKLYDLQLFTKIHPNSNFGKPIMRKTVNTIWVGSCNSRYWGIILLKNEQAQQKVGYR